MHEVIPQSGYGFDFTGSCEADAPGRDLEKFYGRVEFEGRKFSLDTQQLLLKGASLKNTKWIVGFVVYTGEDTKIMMNSLFKTSRKIAKFDGQISMFVLQIFLLQLLMSLVLAAMGQFLNSYGELDDGIVVDYLPKGIFGFNKSVLNFFTYFLLMSTLIPISLFVSIECKRFLISRWFEVDSEMYSLIQDRPAKVSNSAVINDLGQISYLFSDKTGTLTANEMKFKSMTIGELTFGDL